MPIDTARTGRTSVTVGTSAVTVDTEQVLSRRVSFTIINTSSGGQVISLAFGQDAIAGQGIVLSPGGYYVESEDSDFKPTNDYISAIASGAGGTIAFTNRTKFPGQ